MNAAEFIEEIKKIEDEFPIDGSISSHHELSSWVTVWDGERSLKIESINLDFMTPKKLKAFKEFLEKAGSEILEPTNEWELIRFKANNEIGIVYQNKFGVPSSFVMQAKTAWEAFTEGKPYSAVTAVNRKRKSVLLRSILKRDGDCCFYCGLIMKSGSETIEHIFSINQGGTNHMSNLALAHEECNKKASSLPVVKKILLREKMRGKL